MRTEKAAGFYHRTYKFIKRYCMSEFTMAAACTISLLGGVALAMITSLGLDSQSPFANAGTECVYVIDERWNF